MACHGARRLLGMTENLFTIIGIESITAALGVEMRGPFKTSPQLEKVLHKIRETIPTLQVDRYMANDLETARALVANNALVAVVSSDILPRLGA
jgi:histidine ammonia-lyase